MRFADQPVVQVETHVAASPEDVWRLVTDLDLLVAVSEELQAASWEDADAGPALGSRYVGTNRNEHFGEWQTTSTITECEPPNVFAWTVGELDEPNTTWRFTLTSADGGTAVSQWMRVGPGESGLKWAVGQMPDKEERIVERRLTQFRSAMQANLAEIKRRAESA